MLSLPSMESSAPSTCHTGLTLHQSSAPFAIMAEMQRIAAVSVCGAGTSSFKKSTDVQQKPVRSSETVTLGKTSADLRLQPMQPHRQMTATTAGGHDKDWQSNCSPGARCSHAARLAVQPETVATITGGHYEDRQSIHCCN